MPYLPPFDVLKARLGFADGNPEQTVVVSYDEFLEAIRALLAVVEVDEAWYLARYPDVAAAIEAGKIASAREHFLFNGYFEGRWPFAMNVDERWYLGQNPGVADYIRAGRLQTAQQHFDHDGYREGRLPFLL